MTEESRSGEKRPNEGDTVIADEPEVKRAKIEDETPVNSADAPAASVGEPSEEPKPKKEKNLSRREAKARHGAKGKDRDDKKSRKRGSRNDELAAAAASGETGPVSTEPKGPRLPKRAVALLIGFCGTGCAGMQIQPNVRTIEGVLFNAMVAAGAVSQDNADDPTKVNLGRAARTDAGVHAAGNVVSIKMITEVPGVPDIVAQINEKLPPEIRVWSFVRVQNSFNARLSCDSRKYTYFFPSYLLLPPKPGCNLHTALQEHNASISTPVDTSEAGAFWVENGVKLGRDTELALKRKWRIGTSQMERLREAVKRYEGTHNFHNFTVGRDFGDRSNQRHMKRIEIADPAVYGETEWISVMFHGQSFMLHQIRKMMCALVMSCRTATPAQVIEEMYGPRNVFVPKMPSLGLLLENPIFDSYNVKVSTSNTTQSFQIGHTDYRPPIDFELHRETMETFKETFIYESMRSIEDRDGVFDSWIRTIDSYKGADLLYLNGKGNIPKGSVIQKGVKRENPLVEKKKFDATSFPVEGAKADEDDEPEDEEQPLTKAKLMEMEG